VNATCDTCGATFDDGIAAGHHEIDHEEEAVSGPTYRIEEYDRLSLLYNDAVEALAEAEAILEAAGGRAGLSVATGAAATVCEYLCDEIERYAPHSVKA
jgi:hypothetical protein